jgi:hypothetical protein
MSWNLGSNFFDTESSVKGDYDWGSASKGIDWSGGFGVDKDDNLDAGKFSFGAKDKKGGSFLENWLSGAKGDYGSEEKYRNIGQKGVYGGEWNRPFGGQVLENLGVVYPMQHSPMFIPGMEAQKGNKGSQIGRLAGAALGAFGGPAGASLGGMIGGAAGSLFD